MAESVYKVIELVGTSTESWEKAAAAAVKLPNAAGGIAVAAAQVPGVKVSDVRPAVIAAVPSQAGQVVAALARANLRSSLKQEAGTPAVVAVVPANSNKTGIFF